MKYEVTTAVYPMGRKDFPYVPNTLKTRVFDSETGLGKLVWSGYVSVKEGKKPELTTENFSTALDSLLR